MAGQCERVKGNGERCKAPSVSGSRFCFFHDPAKAEQRKAARRRGGQRNKPATLSPDAPNVEIKEVADVVTFLGETLNQTRRGELDHRICNALGYICSVLLKALQAGELEERIAALEAAAAAANRGQGR